MQHQKRKQKWTRLPLLILTLLTAACSTGRLEAPKTVAPVTTPTLFAYSPAFFVQLHAELKDLESRLPRADMTTPAPACARDTLSPGCSATRRFESDAITVRDQIRAPGKAAS